MKIVCDSCSAKYSIADEKVAGKVFKIRCKKCSNVIVVRGDQVETGFEDDEATRVFDYGGEAVWHVVVDGDQQGPFTPLQLGAMLNDGSIDNDSYVWKEGFDGWKALSEVPELVAALGSGAAESTAAPAAAAAPAADDADPFSAGSDPFAGGDDDGASADEDPFAAAAGSDGGDLFSGGDDGGGGDAGGDLFASGGGGGGGDLFSSGGDDVVSSGGGPRVSEAQAMTGQRNENSVLFSLSNLQALATGDSAGSGPAASSPAPQAASPTGMAQGEGSGLIDIRALASATSATAPGPAASSGGGVDDLLSIGTGPAIGSALGAPVLAPAAPEPEAAPAAQSSGGGTNKILIALVAVLVIALIGGGAYVLTRPDPTPATPPVGSASEGGEGGSDSTPAGSDSTMAAEPSTPETTTEQPASPDPAPEAATAADDDDSSMRPRDSHRRDRDRDRDRGMEAAAAMTTATMTSTQTMTEMRPTQSMGSIDDLLGRALGMETMMAAPMADLPDTPSRSAVGRALGARRAAVRACGGGQSGSAPVSVTFSGSTGRVSSARVTGGPFAGNGCIARAVRGARVPPFRRSSFSVTFPYRL